MAAQGTGRRKGRLTLREVEIHARLRKETNCGIVAIEKNAVTEKVRRVK